ncbi:MAG: hypothetical protein M1823_005622 [Watsoniomyces obsoletus]|nr:MAG: hypothetical protein M1823_005622 [Watsoniomyces obsoletus]
MYILRQALVLALALLATTDALPRPLESGRATLVRRTTPDFGQPPPARPELDVQGREVTVRAYIRGSYAAALKDERFQWWQGWHWDCLEKKASHSRHTADEIPDFKEREEWCQQKYLEIWDDNPNQLPAPLPPPSAPDKARRTSMQASTTPGTLLKSWFLSKVNDGLSPNRLELESGDGTRRAAHSLAMAAASWPRSFKMPVGSAALPLPGVI